MVYGLPDDYFHRYRDDVRAVTRDQAAAAVRRHVRPAEAQVVIVGDASQIAKPLEDLRLGSLEVREARPVQRGA